MSDLGDWFDFLVTIALLFLVFWAARGRWDIL